MAIKAKPVTITQAGTNPQPSYDPEPLVVIGTFPGAAVAPATTANFGTVKKVATQADFAGADITALKVELNAWLAKMKTANIQA